MDIMQNHPEGEQEKLSYWGTEPLWENLQMSKNYH